jgi:hypothetical protein
MTPVARLLLAAVCWAAAGAGGAQTAAAPAAPAAAPAPPAAPAVERRVVEDEGVRIEQLHYRGQVQSVTVQSKLGGARPYEIVVGRSGRDPSLYKGAVGQSRWSLVSF